jgi:hypothetical protein
MFNQSTTVEEALVIDDFRGNAAQDHNAISLQTELVCEAIFADDSPTNSSNTHEKDLYSVPNALEGNRTFELAEMHRQLEGKDELISALVVQLEHVVDQMDRMQRSGHERDRSLATVKSAGLSEDHQQVMSDLQRVVDHWETLQTSNIFGRIETELSEMRSLLEGRSRTLSVSSIVSLTAESKSYCSNETSRSSTTETGQLTCSNTGNAGSTWETMKRELLGEGQTDRPLSVVPVETCTHETADGEADFDLMSVTAPLPIGLDLATRDELKRACVDRDVYIIKLTRMLRSRRAVSLPKNGQDIVEMSEEQSARVNPSANALEDPFRLAEVEMSLERARLSRERVQLETDRESIHHQLKRLGLTSIDDMNSITVENGSASERRWMRFLGLKRHI